MLLWSFSSVTPFAGACQHHMWPPTGLGLLGDKRLSPSLRPAQGQPLLGRVSEATGGKGLPLGGSAGLSCLPWHTHSWHGIRPLPPKRGCMMDVEKQPNVPH